MISGRLHRTFTPTLKSEPTVSTVANMLWARAVQLQTTQKLVTLIAFNIIRPVNINFISLSRPLANFSRKSWWWSECYWARRELHGGKAV